jgi:hypothetical protein
MRTQDKSGRSYSQFHFSLSNRIQFFNRNVTVPSPMIAKFIPNGRFTRLLSVFTAFALLAAPNRAADADSDRETCRKNLETIYKAIQAYRADHKDLPGWLSDLVPKYLKDPNALTCPVVRRTGEVNTFGVEDPRISTAYLYEFADTPIPKSIVGGSDHTMKEWKRRQMGLVGSKVPMVRCHHHKPVLNLSFDGRVFEGEGGWEAELRNEVDPADLTPDRLFASEAAIAAAVRAKSAIPPRDPKTPANCIDLSRFYNAAMTESWHPNNPGEPTANNLAWMPQGFQKFGDIDFDARGIIQLSSKKLNLPRYPFSVKNIKVEQKATRLHFLHSTGWSANDGTPVCSYVMHMANGKTHEFTVRYGDHVSDWVAQRDPNDTKASMLAWAGKSPANDTGAVLRVYKTQWINPEPDQVINSIDYLSANLDPAPFLIAITVENP